MRSPRASALPPILNSSSIFHEIVYFSLVFLLTLCSWVRSPLERYIEVTSFQSFPSKIIRKLSASVYATRTFQRMSPSLDAIAILKCFRNAIEYIRHILKDSAHCCYARSLNIHQHYNTHWRVARRQRRRERGGREKVYFFRIKQILSYVVGTERSGMTSNGTLSVQENQTGKREYASHPNYVYTPTTDEKKTK